MDGIHYRVFAETSLVKEKISN